MENTIKKNRGFTLVEISVVIFMILMISTFVFIDYKRIKKQSVVESAAYQIAADIRKTQTMAGLNDSLCPLNEAYKYSWGIYFSISTENSYEIFSDCDADNAKDSMEKRETKTIDPEAKICGTGDNYIVFIPPDPDIMINNNTAQLSATISVCSKDGTIMRTITINKSGMIDVD